MSTFFGLVGALFSALIGWWKPKKDPQAEELKHEVTAQRNEAKNLAEPVPDWTRVVDDL